MKNTAFILLCVAVLSASPGSLAQQATAEDDAQGSACMVTADHPAFSDFERHRANWAANYQARRMEFHGLVVAIEVDVSRCAARALRRDLTRNSRTSFGVQLAADGRVARVAMLSANHADNLYAACIARTLCTFQLAPPVQGSEEVLLFHFNLNRKARPHERPWAIDGHGLVR